MKIDGKNYDLNKVAESVSLNQIVKNESLFDGIIFDSLDNLDGKKEGKLSKLDLMSVFQILQSVDDGDGELTDAELSKFSRQLLELSQEPMLEKLINNIPAVKNFVIKLLQVNENIVKEEEQRWNSKHDNQSKQDVFIVINQRYKVK